MSENKNNMINIGGLWLNKSQNGEIYFSGYFGNARLLIFKNGFKEKENQPDYVMYVAKAEKRSDVPSTDEFESEMNRKLESENGNEATTPPSENLPDIPF